MSQDLPNEVTRDELSALVRDLWGKLAGPSSLLWIRALRRLLRKENPWPAIEVWKTVTIGGKNRGMIRRALRNAGFNTTSDVESMIKDRRAFGSGPVKELDLARLTLSEIGLPTGGELEDIMVRAEELGLERCPQSLGPYLRLAHQGSELMYVAMDPIVTIDGTPRIFELGRVSGAPGVWLMEDIMRSWMPSARFVFVIPRKKAA